MPASIQDVADKAGVSISTVSRVLNGRKVVNVKTRERVQEAIKQLGYRPNVFARGLMLRKSNLLGLVLPDLHGEFYSEIIRGADTTARGLGYHLLLSSVSATDDGHDVLATVCNQGLSDGIVVMVSEMNSRIRETLSQFDSPLVIMDGDLPGLRHDTVAIDQLHGARAVMHHLASQNSDREIIFVGGPETNLDTIDRQRAYEEVLQATGKAVKKQNIYYLDYSYDRALDLGEQEVARWAKQKAALFAANDEMAAGIIDAATDAGVAVPDQLAVVGFDDTRVARLTRPQLTTVRVPMASMGAEAIKLLHERLSEPGAPPRKVVLESELVVRRSCGAASEPAAVAS